MKKDDVKELVDTRGNVYVMNNQGFVAPVQPQPSEDTEEDNAEKSE